MRTCMCVCECLCVSVCVCVCTWMRGHVCAHVCMCMCICMCMCLCVCVNVCVCVFSCFCLSTIWTVCPYRQHSEKRTLFFFFCTPFTNTHSHSSANNAPHINTVSIIFTSLCTACQGWHLLLPVCFLLLQACEFPASSPLRQLIPASSSYFSASPQCFHDNLAIHTYLQLKLLDLSFNAAPHQGDAPKQHVFQDALRVVVCQHKTSQLPLKALLFQMSSIVKYTCEPGLPSISY